MKILHNFGGNRPEFVERLKIINFSHIISTEHGKIRKGHPKICRFGPKLKKNLKIFKKILRFFDQPLWKIDFLKQIFLNISGLSAFFSESIYLCKIIPFFYNIFFCFRVPCSPPYATALSIACINLFGFRGWGVETITS